MPKIRCILEEKGKEREQLGVMETSEALGIAESKGLDLVEVAPNAAPPVCKIMDYGKFKYEKAKKEKESKKRQHVVKVKEIKLHPRTEEHDYNFKKNHAREFLESGEKVKVSMVYKGREMAHVDYGRHLMDKIKEDLEDVSSIDYEAKMEGRTMTSLFSPLKAKSKTKKTKASGEKKEKEEDKTK